MTYAFTFDASACSGCKACQAACKDKNDLPVGVLWRRVYEVSGGSWAQEGAAWTKSVFAYNLSIACNHCVHPKCAGVCPTDAYVVRPDGILYIDESKCIGCGYCAWACPYDAPQVDQSAGYMTKCDLCYDNLDAGLPPACVAACPLRCLDLVEISDQGMEDWGVALWKVPGEEHPFPLPKLSRTEPHLIIKSHIGAKQIGKGTQVNNREETSPAHPFATAKGEIPLIIFTLLAQMAIGAFGTISAIYWVLGDKLVAGEITLIPLLAVGVAITVALLVSFFHLGKPKNAWRVLNHLRKSWLSREILFISGFAGLWAIHTGLRLLQIGTFSEWTIFVALTALCGLAALYSMQRVYQLRSMPAWNTGRTLLEFAISTVGLGCLLTGALLPRDTPAGLIFWIAMAAIIAFSAAGLVTISTAKTTRLMLSKYRGGLIAAGLLATVALFIWPTSAWMGSMFLVFIIALVEEAIGRWLFYTRRNPGI
ncbi:MAG TPA: DmsC/YnfH family molybdoenzyme membrane anchor subunit [Anaerolineales bacterium]